MEPLYDMEEAVKLEPQIYKIDASTTLSLFPVPKDNAVGTNDIRNAVSILSFPKEKLSVKHYFKRSLRDIRGGGTYLPVISKDMIGFGHTRAFYLFNFKNGNAEEYRIVFSLDDTIEEIAVADAEKRRFIFEIESHRHGSPDPWDISHSFHLIDLSEKKVNLLKKLPRDKGATWIAAYSRIFLWYFAKKEMQVFDLNLEPSHHPLADIIMKNKNIIEFTWFIPHPSLPFAILFGGGDIPDTLICWGEGRNNSLQPLLEDGSSQYSFSPDGKWLTFKTYMERDKYNTYLMPVSEKYPNYLGTPILLKNDYFSGNYSAWTNNPVSFVGNNGRTIYRWELTEEAQKFMIGDDYNKYETFHDYIVERDLESLKQKAAEGSMLDKVKRLIASGGDINAKNNHGYTPLMKAAKYGNTDAVKLLISAKADLQVKDNYKNTAFTLAIRSGHIDIVKLLMTPKDNVDAALREAVQAGHANIVKLMLRANANVHTRHYGKTPLMEAAARSHRTHVAKLLIEAKADVNARISSTGDTILTLAIRQNYQNVAAFVKLLIAAKANVNANLQWKITPLMEAIQKDNAEVVKLLIDAKADVNAMDDFGNTPLLYAIGKENAEMVKLLIDAGADVNVKYKNGGFTVLQVAQDHRYFEIEKLLKNAGAKK